MKEIIIDVSADGEISIETRGFTGKACLKKVQVYERPARQGTITTAYPCLLSGEAENQEVSAIVRIKIKLNFKRRKQKNE